MTNWIVKHHKENGFTLIELIFVMLIIAIVAAFALPRWIGASPNLYAQNQQLLNDIRYTQNLAMTRGQRYRINFTAPNTYSITNTSGTAVPNPSTGQNTVTLNTGISFGTFTNVPNNLIAFDEEGIPYTDSSASTALSSTATIVLSSGGVTHSITIAPGTGKATAQ